MMDGFPVYQVATNMALHNQRVLSYVPCIRARVIGSETHVLVHVSLVDVGFANRFSDFVLIQIGVLLTIRRVQPDLFAAL